MSDGSNNEGKMKPPIIHLYPDASSPNTVVEIDPLNFYRRRGERIVGSSIFVKLSEDPSEPIVKKTFGKDVVFNSSESILQKEGITVVFYKESIVTGLKIKPTQADTQVQFLRYDGNNYVWVDMPQPYSTREDGVTIEEFNGRFDDETGKVAFTVGEVSINARLSDRKLARNDQCRGFVMRTKKAGDDDYTTFFLESVFGGTPDLGYLIAYVTPVNVSTIPQES